MISIDEKSHRAGFATGAALMPGSSPMGKDQYSWSIGYIEGKAIVANLSKCDYQLFVIFMEKFQAKNPDSKIVFQQVKHENDYLRVDLWRNGKRKERFHIASTNTWARYT